MNSKVKLQIRTIKQNKEGRESSLVAHKRFTIEKTSISFYLNLILSNLDLDMPLTFQAIFLV